MHYYWQAFDCTCETGARAFHDRDESSRIRAGAGRDREQAKPPRVALQVGNRVSVQTRAWGNDFARSVHSGRF